VSTPSQRIDCLRYALRQEPVDAFLVSDPANVTYLTGFRGDDSYLLLDQDHLFLVTDSRYTEQAAAEAPQCEIVKRDGSIIKETAKAFGRLGAKSLGIEAASMSVSSFRDLAEALEGVEPLPKKGLVEKLREVKDEGEIERIRKAAALADATLTALRGQIVPGMTEREVANRIDFSLREAGARRPSFEPIVAARQRSSLPHAQATDARLAPGDAVLIDWGAERDLYSSDCTRMFFLAAPDARWREVYATVRRAQELAIEAIRAGAGLREVDAVARQHISQAGYGSNFGHGLGHGVGLRVHESPSMNERAEGTLAAGMVVTVEPGIYLPGWGGVRIEDLVVVRQEGAEVLTSLPKELDAVIL